MSYFQIRQVDNNLTLARIGVRAKAEETDRIAKEKYTT